MAEQTQALIVQPQRELLPARDDWSTMMQMADLFAKSGLLPTGSNPAAALVVMQKGRELGIPPMQALSSIYVVKGKPSTSAELMRALIYRDHGDDALIVDEDAAERSVIRYKRRGWKQYQTSVMTRQDAEQAGLWASSEVWKKYPAQMLLARNTSRVGRTAFPDSLGGMYLTEEAQEAGDGDPVSVGVQVRQEEAPAPSGNGHTVNQATGEIADDAPATPKMIEQLRRKVAEHKRLSGEDYELQEPITVADAWEHKRFLDQLLNDDKMVAEARAQEALEDAVI